MSHTEVVFTDTPDDTNDIIIAVLSESGFEGFEEAGGQLRGYVPSELFRKEIIDQLASQYHFNYSVQEIHETNWNEVWEANFQPVEVDDFCLIRADFHESQSNITHEIIITPKMSFGTGHHATTFMMIRQMQDIDFTNKVVMDFGTGTGVLAILAQKLGASAVTAIDNDDWSIANAEENFRKNNTLQIYLQKADTASAHKQFDVILANITRNVILENFALFAAELSTNGILLLSGLLQEDEDLILKEAGTFHLRIQKKLTQGNWISLRFTH